MQSSVRSMEEQMMLYFACREHMPILEALTVACSMLLFLRTGRLLLTSTNCIIFSIMPHAYDIGIYVPREAPANLPSQWHPTKT